MKYLLVILIFCPFLVESQNLLQSTGNVGIGTLDPKSKLHVLDNGRDYYVNRMISGTTEDGQGLNYLLLHKIYTNTLLNDYYVMGRLTAVRGATWLWNRKWTMEVNTSSAYNTNRGSLISYNEPASLVTLNYGGESYLAVQINNASSLGNFSFTGYAKNELLTLVYDQDVTGVQPFISLDPVSIQGDLSLGTTFRRNYLKLSSSECPEIRFTTPVDNEIIRIGTFYGGSTSYPLQNGDFYLFSAQTNSMGLVFSKSGNVNITPQIGNVGIGTTIPTEKLSVNGTILGKKVKVSQAAADWPDYVFDSSYQLPSLEAVSSFVKENKHLPEMPSASTVEKNGHDLGEIQKMLLKKMEEMTLYMIQLKQENETLKKRVEQIELQSVNPK